MNSCDRRKILQTLAGGILASSSSAQARLRGPGPLARSPADSSGASPANPPAEIRTAITSLDEARLDAQPFGDLRLYLEGPTEQLKSLTFGSLELKPGQSPHPPHTHPEEEIMLITQGHGEISLQGKVTAVGPGAIMYCGSNRLHGILNTGQSRLTFYYFKWVGK